MRPVIHQAIPCSLYKVKLSPRDVIDLNFRRFRKFKMENTGVPSRTYVVYMRGSSCCTAAAGVCLRSKFRGNVGWIRPDLCCPDGAQDGTHAQTRTHRSTVRGCHKGIP